MALLLHLNGPPGVGKSTIAALWAERHPGTIDLDLDVLLRLVGGWRDPARDTHFLLRPAARAMAAAHLGGGHDVVVPQYLARPEEIGAFEDVARAAGSEFHEVVLLADRAQAVSRFDARPDESEWHVHNRRLVADQGGREFLEEMYERLLTVVAQRPGAVVVRAEDGEVEATYEAVEGAVRGRSGGGAEPG